jgi:hypothetical protein
LLIKADGFGVHSLSTKPDVAYYDFLQDLPLNNPLSLYSSEYANILTICRFTQTGENENMQKKDGLFFDLMKCQRICALAENIEEEINSIREPFLIQYLKKKKNKTNFTAFEWGLNKKLPEEKGKINLYGFKTVSLPENDRQTFKDMSANVLFFDQFTTYPSIKILYKFMTFCPPKII